MFDSAISQLPSLEPMKALLYAILVASLVSAMSAQGNTPSSGLKPQAVVMKEWWRVDDKGYGVNGMTWLDNFYEGKGVLVVSTPSGVQSWQLRYPGDTVNVFSWTGGDAHIRTGDFNGDGVTDYLDGKGNVYLGQAQGLPKAPVLVAPLDQISSNSVCDINDDGIDDVITVSQNNTTVLFSVKLGDRSDSTLQHPSVGVKRYFDSARSVISIYTKSKIQHRLLVRLGAYYYGNGTDALELYEMKWSPIDSLLTFKKLSERVLNTFGQSWHSGGLLQPNASSVYRMEAERIDVSDVNYYRSNLKIYDLSQDSIASVVTTRCDSVAAIIPQNLSINSDSTVDFVITKQDGHRAEIYNGIISDSISLLATASFCLTTVLTGAEITDPKHLKYLCGAGNYLIDGYMHSCFSIDIPSDSLQSTVEDQPISSKLHVRVLPTPTASGQQVELETRSRGTVVCELSIVNLLGVKIVIDPGFTVQDGTHLHRITLPSGVAKGEYVMQLLGHDCSAHCSIIIE